LKIALVSLDQKWEDKAYNLQRCQSFIEQAAKHAADLIVFPEMTLTGFSFNTAQIAEPQASSATREAFSSLAGKYHIAIVAGVVLKGEGGKCLNTLLAFSSDGIEQARYIKIHPFSFAGEHRFFDSGNCLATMDLCGLKLGFTICYDLRFPELYSALARDCNVLINIANWPKKRIRHWHTLLEARAIENQIFMIGVNRVGEDNNQLQYEKSSCVINPDGNPLESLLSEVEIDIYEIELQALENFRCQFSTRHDRLPNLYKALL
jgi:omega-amidase